MSVQGVGIPKKVTGPSGAVIEYSGGTIVASHVMRLQQTSGPIPRAAGMALAPCQGTGEGDIVVTDATTLNADATLALFNPGSADADVTISLLADGRKIEPVRLLRRLVGSHSRRDFKLGDFAFNARAVTAIVHANAGRVAAEVLLRTGAGAELLPAQPPALNVVAVAGRSGQGAETVTTVVGTDDAGFDVREILSSNQQSARGFPPSQPPSGTKIVPVADAGQGKPAAFSMFVSVGSPIVAATRWVVRGPGGHSEIASLPAMSAATGWGSVIGGLGSFGVERVILVNNHTTPVAARVSTITDKRVTRRTVTLQPGRLVLFAIGKGTGPIGLLVQANGPIVTAVIGSAVAGTSGTTAAAMPATPISLAREVGVAIDPRAGLPAVISSS
jgi:hypothetical protein